MTVRLHPAPRYRVRRDADGELWLVGGAEPLPLTLERLSRLARILCRAQRKAAACRRDASREEPHAP